MSELEEQIAEKEEEIEDLEKEIAQVDCRLRGFILVQHFSLISGKLLNIFIFIQKVRQTPFAA